MDERLDDRSGRLLGARRSTRDRVADSVVGEGGYGVVGDGDGETEGVGVGVTLGVGSGTGVADGVGVALGDGGKAPSGVVVGAGAGLVDNEGLALGAGVADGVGAALRSGAGDGSAVAGLAAPAAPPGATTRVPPEGDRSTLATTGVARGDRSWRLCSAPGEAPAKVATASSAAATLTTDEVPSAAPSPPTARSRAGSSPGSVAARVGGVPKGDLTGALSDAGKGLRSNRAKPRMAPAVDGAGMSSARQRRT